MAQAKEDLGWATPLKQTWSLIFSRSLPVPPRGASQTKEVASADHWLTAGPRTKRSVNPAGMQPGPPTHCWGPAVGQTPWNPHPPCPPGPVTASWAEGFLPDQQDQVRPGRWRRVSAPGRGG